MQKKKKTSGYFDTEPESAHVHRHCDRDGCSAQGSYKAPKNRNNLTDYFWFCLDHVREYNLQWNYYQGMSDSEVENHRRKDTVWERPSWPFGPKAQYKKFRAAFDRKWADFRGAFGTFEDDHDDAASHSHNYSQKPMDYQTVRALNVLGLTPPLDFEAVKRQYKHLVKRFHPDLHGGDKDAEERFKSINEAFQTVKRNFGDTN